MKGAFLIIATAIATASALQGTYEQRVQTVSDETDWDEEEGEIKETPTMAAYQKLVASQDTLKQQLIKQKEQPSLLEKPKTVEMKVKTEEASHGTGSLPSGWTEHKRVENGRKFYFHKDSNTVIWDDKLPKNTALKEHLKTKAGKEKEGQVLRSEPQAQGLVQVSAPEDEQKTEKAPEQQVQAQEQVAQPESASATGGTAETGTGVWDVMFWVLLCLLVFVAGWWAVKMRLHERALAAMAESMFRFKKWCSSLLKGGSARASAGQDDGSSTSESSLGSSERSGTTDSSGMGGLNGHLQGVIDRVKKNFQDVDEGGKYEKQADEEQAEAASSEQKPKGYVRGAKK